jgi:hypothetical protein
MTAKKQRLVTEHTDAGKTVKIIKAAVYTFIERTGDGGPLADLTAKQINATVGLVFYALGEVFERQFYPSDREQCQEVARAFHVLAGLPVPDGTIVPDVA